MSFITLLCLLILSSIVPAFAGLQSQHDKSAARIMVYFNVGRDNIPTKNVTIEQFKSHLLELTEGDYNVLPLQHVIDTYKEGTTLPLNSVVLTFDGGDKSILHNAVPLLEEYKLPYTLFIAPARAHEDSPRYINWRELKTLLKTDLITLGIHSDNYSHSSTQNTENIRRTINNAASRFRENIGFQPMFFSYPFGEYSKIYKDIISAYGFKAAFGQHSGVAYARADHYALPRFTMTENYGDEQRFKMTANALPFPIHDITPSYSYLDKVPAIGFTIDDNFAGKLSNISCFASGQSKPETIIIGKRVEIRLEQPILKDRFRVNCTLPVKSTDSTKPKQWRWFGLLLTINDGNR